MRTFDEHQSKGLPARRRRDDPRAWKLRLLVHLWSAWRTGREATACREALGLLVSEEGCIEAACRAPRLLSSGFLSSCAADEGTRISLARLRHRWEDAAGMKISRCLDETHRALKDPAKTNTLAQSCAGEGKTEAAFREAARRVGMPR